MKRRRKVILIAISFVLVALFIGIAWAKINGEFYAMDRSGMPLTAGETARHLFSDDVENGLLYVSAQFPRQRYDDAISQSKALKLLRRSSPKCEPIFWANIDDVGPVGFFVERKLGEVTMYCEHGEFIFQILIDSGNDLKVRHFGDGVPFQGTQFLVIPEGMDFSNWEFRKEPSIDSLSYFGRNSLPDPSTPIEELAFHGVSLFKEKAKQSEGILIYFSESAQAWRVKKWKQEWPLADWKAILAEEAENRLNK